MLEVHGPHLPIGADTLGVLYEVEHASQRLSTALPDWSIVVMPPVHYGGGGANEVGGRLVHAGTYAIRQSTLRALVADLGAQVAENGFKWIFVLNGHAAPTHNIAINEASDFVSETFGVTMLHVTAILSADAALEARRRAIDGGFFSTDELLSFGLDLHAGVAETSALLAIRPELVDPMYRSLPRQVVRSLDELPAMAGAPGWQAYLSDPARASAEHGRAVERWWIDAFTELIVRATRGENMLARERSPETIPAPVAPVLEAALADEAAFEAALEEWLARRRPER
jgi:creatinine amidohydrolase